MFPGSRRNPQFGRESLAHSLPEHGIEYIWVSELCGRRRARADSHNTGWQIEGFRAYADYMDTAAFRIALTTLEAAAATAPTAYMCTERLWWQCHRRLISDALAVRGAEVLHILDAGKSRPHQRAEFLRVDDDHLTYPDPV